MTSDRLYCAVFDIGNVVWEFRPLFDSLFTRIAAYLGTDLASFRRHYYEKNGLYHNFELDKLDFTAWLSFLNPVFTPQLTTRLLEETFNLSDFNRYLIPSTLDYLTRLKQQGITIGYLSNAENFVHPYIHARLDNYFDFGITSWQVGLRKPDPAIYYKIFDHGDWTPGQVLFVDDKPDNIAAASASGINTILYTGPSSLIPLPTPFPATL